MKGIFSYLDFQMYCNDKNCIKNMYSILKKKNG